MGCIQRRSSMKTLATLAVELALASTAALAQHADHSAATEPGLPQICLANAPSDATVGGHGSMSMPTSAHEDLMAGMDRMNADMMAGGTAEDIDVAFICSMIPHHQGAVDMAKAELAHGNDPQARALAEAIITGQEKEIAEMLAWLEAQK